MNDPRTQEAIQQHQRGDLINAEKLYREVLNDNPEDTDLLHLLGIVLSQQNQHQDALNTLLKALELAPDSATIHNSLGNVYKHLQQPDEAKKHYEEALANEPNLPSTHNNLGILLFNLGDYTNAIKHYEAAIKLKPHYSDAYFNLGLTHLRNNSIDAAIKALQTAIDIDPNHIEAISQLAQLYLEQDYPEKAIDLYRQRVKRNPQHAQTRVNLGAAYLRQGETKQAIAELKRALDFDPDHQEGHYNLGLAYLNQGDLSSALEHFLYLLKFGANKDVYYNIGVIYMYQDHHADAITYLQQAIHVDPRMFEAYMNLAATYLKINDRQKAVRIYERALNLRPHDKEVVYILQALTQTGSPDHAPKAYIEHLFDQYAPYYDKHLSEFLHYAAPRALFTAVEPLIPEDRKPIKIMDLGCGTGLCGELFKPMASPLLGVDLSKKMIEIAEKKQLYDALVLADVHDALRIHRNNDLILAADVLGYIGDLSQLFELASKALVVDGYFAFTIEKAPTDISTYYLQIHARYVHSPDYIITISQQNQFKIEIQEDIQLRTQGKQAVIGQLFVLSRH